MSQDYHDYQKHLGQNRPDGNSAYQGYQADYANQPSYNYRDQSFYPTPEALPAITTSRRRFHMLRRLIQIGFVLLPFVGSWILASHYAATYNTYQKGSCTISSKDVNEVDNRDKHGHITSRNYYPRLYYVVTAIDEKQTSAIGYDGPTARSYSSHGEAQTVVDQYKIGQKVPCWYNPVALEKAFIVFYGFTSWDWVWISFWGFCGFGAFALSIYLLCDWMVWRLLALRKRGVVTQGRVIELKRRRHRRGVSWNYIINFRALEEPDRTRKVTKGSTIGDLRVVGTLLPVCYDPLFPRYRCDGEWPTLTGPIVWGMTIIVLTFIGLVILYIVWLIP